MAKTQKRPGRPPIGKGKVRKCIVTLRLLPEERATFVKAARETGYSLSEWMRHSLKSVVDRKG